MSAGTRRRRSTRCGRGANAGWPCYKGTQRTTFASYDVCARLYAAVSAQLPIHTYLKNGVQASVVGGIHYSGTSYPAAYRGAWFVGDYSRQTLWSLATDTSGPLTRAPESGEADDRRLLTPACHTPAA